MKIIKNLIFQKQLKEKKVKRLKKKKKKYFNQLSMNKENLKIWLKTILRS